MGMKMRFGSVKAICGMAALAVASASPAFACPVCFGASDSLQTKATQAGILALLVVTVLILGSFAAFFLYLRRRIKLFEESTAVHQGAHGGSY